MRPTPFAYTYAALGFAALVLASCLSPSVREVSFPAAIPVHATEESQAFPLSGRLNGVLYGRGRRTQGGWQDWEVRRVDVLEDGRVRLPLLSDESDEFGVRTTGSFEYRIYLALESHAAQLFLSENEQLPSRLELRPTVSVRLQLDGEAPPGEPVVVPAAESVDALYGKPASGRYFDLRSGDRESEWTVSLLEGERYVIGWPSEEVFGYLSEPFEARREVAITFSPGPPSAVHYDLSLAPSGVEVFPANVFLLKKILSRGRATHLSWGANETRVDSGIVQFPAIAGGNYRLKAVTPGSKTPRLYDVRDIVVESGKIHRVLPVYPRVDTTEDDGDMSIRGRVVNVASGRGVPEQTVSIRPLKKDYSLVVAVSYPSTLTNDEGEFEFRGVDPRYIYEVTTTATNETETSVLLPYSTENRGKVWSVSLTTGYSPVPETTGAVVPDLTLELQDGSRRRLSELQARMLVIDVWASWCAPCRRALPVQDSLARELGSDQIVFLALSIDESKENWTKSVARMQLRNLEHAWLAPSNAARFSKPIPYYLVLDSARRILASGNDLDVRSVVEGAFSGGGGR